MRVRDLSMLLSTRAGLDMLRYAVLNFSTLPECCALCQTCAVVWYWLKDDEALWEELVFRQRLIVANSPQLLLPALRIGNHLCMRLPRLHDIVWLCLVEEAGPDASTCFVRVRASDDWFSQLPAEPVNRRMQRHAGAAADDDAQAQARRFEKIDVLMLYVDKKATDTGYSHHISDFVGHVHALEHLQRLTFYGIDNSDFAPLFTRLNNVSELCVAPPPRFSGDTSCSIGLFATERKN